MNEILEAIEKKFGSIEKYATSRNVTRQNIYGKAKIQSRKFLKELRDQGIIIDSNLAGRDIDNSAMIMNANEDELNRLKEENKRLREDVEYFKGLVKDLTKRKD